jgi:hypothetical protein
MLIVLICKVKGKIKNEMFSNWCDKYIEDIIVNNHCV